MYLMTAAQIQAQADLNACIALADARKAEARLRGQAEIDWPEYFRNIDINWV